MFVSHGLYFTVFDIRLGWSSHEQIFAIWEAVTRQTQIDFTLPNIFIEVEKKTFFFVIQMSRENSQIIASALGGRVRGNVTKMGHDSEHPYCSRSISGVMCQEM